MGLPGSYTGNFTIRDLGINTLTSLSTGFHSFIITQFVDCLQIFLSQQGLRFSFHP